MTQQLTAQGQADQLQKKKSGIGGRILNHGFIGVDTYMRVKDGENLPMAVGKAVLTNAAFSLLPGGIVGGIAVMGAMAAPEIMNAMDGAAGNLNAKKQQFGGDFQESRTQMRSMQTGLNNMQNARMHATKSMANHARGAQRVY